MVEYFATTSAIYLTLVAPPYILIPLLNTVSKKEPVGKKKGILYCSWRDVAIKVGR